MIKKIILLVSLSLLGSYQAVYANDMLQETMKCEKVFGNPIFEKLEINFSTEKEGWWSDRKTKIVVNYVHSGLDSNYYTRPIEMDTTAYKASHPHMIQISFDDSMHGNNDYSGGTIKFKEDDVLGVLAVIDYTSDGPAFFGVLKCDKWPKIIPSDV